LCTSVVGTNIDSGVDVENVDAERAMIETILDT
jgi:hypothetical protein